MRGATRWSAVLLSGLVASCGAGGGPGPNDADSLPVLEATETLRLGSVDDPDVGFSSIADMAVDRDGLLYVLDTQAVEVRVFDGATRVRTIGGAGGGPGELRGPGSMGLRWVIRSGSSISTAAGSRCSPGTAQC